MDVADDAAGEYIAFGQGRSGDGEPIAAAGDRADGLQRGADQVLVRRPRSSRVGDDGLDPGGVRAVVLRLELIHNSGPGLAEGAQPGHFQEEVVAEVQAELEAGAGVVDGVALIEHPLQQCPALSQRFLCVTSGAIAHAEEPDARVLRDAFLQVADIRIVRQAQAEADLRCRCVLFLMQQKQNVQHARIPVHREVDRTHPDILQNGAEVLGLPQEFKRIGTAHQCFQGKLVRIGAASVQRHCGVPGVAVALHATASALHHRALTGHMEGGKHCAVHLHVERAGLLVLQLLLDHGLPLLARGGGEGVEESFSGHRCEVRDPAVLQITGTPLSRDRTFVPCSAGRPCDRCFSRCFGALKPLRSRNIRSSRASS